MDIDSVISALKVRRRPAPPEGTHRYPLTGWDAISKHGAAKFPVQAVRAQFPALQRPGAGIFFDNAAGAQVPRRVLDAVMAHLLEHNVQRGGRYAQSVAVTAAIQSARQKVAAFLNARRPEEIAFGMNATSLIRLVSLAIGDTLGARNEIIITDHDHEANVATWLALERAGARLRWWRVRDDRRLYPADLEPLLGPRTRLLACGAASNALGSLVDVRRAAELVHAAGGELFLDSTHYAAHGPIDVQAMGCDYLVCSAYKAFAPHIAFLWGVTNYWQRYRPFVRSSYPISRRARSRPAPSFTRTSRVLRPRSTTWGSSDAPSQGPAGGATRGRCARTAEPR